MRSIDENRKARPQWVKLATFDGDSALGSCRLTPRPYAHGVTWMRDRAGKGLLHQTADQGDESAAGGDAQQEPAHHGVVESARQPVARGPPHDDRRGE